MKTKYIYLAAAVLVAVPAFAQETYLDTKLVENDLNGTARYVGMGGAMEALGADISTISTNPAGLGLFRKSQVTLSGGLLMQTGAKKRFEYDGVTGNIGGKKTILVLIRWDWFGPLKWKIIPCSILLSNTGKAVTSTSS